MEGVCPPVLDAWFDRRIDVDAARSDAAADQVRGVAGKSRDHGAAAGYAVGLAAEGDAENVTHRDALEGGDAM
jgi:hypothetical protein